MQYYDSALDVIGRTPLVKLNRVMDGAPCLVLAKVEYLNPGGSVKDRPVLTMIHDAEARGLLKAGGTIVEATSGNTGTGLAMVAAIKGYRCILVMPDKVSDEKARLLRAYGAEVVITPTKAPASSPESYYGVAARLASEIPGAFQPNQFANLLNPAAHEQTTGPEIWEQTAGKITHFVCGIGTGGTISGVSHYLKKCNPTIRIIGADPEGSIYSGDTAKSYKVEGIGEDFLPATVDLKAIDRIERVSDKESFLMTRRACREEGLLVGGSSGTALVAARRVVAELPADAIVVVLLPDNGRGYLTKIFNDEWMRANGFLGEEGFAATIGDVLRAKGELPKLITLSPNDSVRRAVELMREFKISQIPVVENSAIVGSINEVAVMQLIFDHADIVHGEVKAVMSRPFPMLDENEEVAHAYKELSLGHAAVVVAHEGKAIGVLTKMDIINYLSAS
ncbi:MAG: cystathionine beta-synthase [Candidatus Eremiobacteraeota bacterium]|nr:cystathionine beta-synthase [Candidatus Eremiobacteraeota bacterium]MBV8262234.1 cystathionine beta-synthase [Candidatus Eremiobacteraeota bacterium]MBV8339739.1 cystathionine beta-synthase [Candidatus Eremiobacteraeota bacterium]MBV8460745.1 cystathionine beta-synthase [Candidatus Eremiobacteraeota bacterium]MBV8596687.1 cystathionine beta-synthase [Candidatus Eremiobacteraeota bacterium]